jgi:tetratricopeptide (TPR) repeat protein
MREGKLDDAIRCHQAGLAVRPDRASDHNNLSRVYMLKHEVDTKNGDLGHAKDDLDNAAKENTISLMCDPNFSGAWHARAQISIMQNDLDEAAKCVQRLMAIDAKSQEALQTLFMVAGKCLELKRPDAAIDLLSPFLKINDAVPQFYNLRGHAYLQKGDLNHALEDFEQIVRLAPQFPEAQEKLREIKRQLANPRK